MGVKISRYKPFWTNPDRLLSTAWQSAMDDQTCKHGACWVDDAGGELVGFGKWKNMSDQEIEEKLGKLRQHNILKTPVAFGLIFMFMELVGKAFKN